ncbi:MAG: DUF1492 domain-containing protein [Oscillospiraceae bacterium]|nr:DUF1492 domain-containing protein [Oscillospiraceae bacterium]
MTTKEWLNRAYKLDVEINLLLEEQKAAYERACGITAVTDSERVQTSKRNTTEEKFVSYAAYSDMINKRIDELYEIKNEILEAINQIENNTLRQLLICRYIRFMTWESVAVELDITFQWAHILHKRALKCVDKFINS